MQNDWTGPRMTLKARPAGLGDQMVQHWLVHGLAHMLGARYVHTPIPTYRMWPGAGEFTGLDLYPEHAEGERICLKLSELVDEDGNVTAPALEAGALLEVAWEYLPGPRLRFLNRAAITAPFPFLSLYEQARRRRGHFAPRDHRPRVVVHLRLGDRAVEQLPDGRMYYRRGAENMVIKADEAVNIPAFTAFTEWQALRRMLDELSAADLDVILLTDGYDRYMMFLRMARKQTGLTPEQIGAIGERLRERLNAFAAGASFRMVTGEGEAETCFAIDALADCDAIVATTGTFAVGVGRKLGGLPADRIFKLDALLTDGAGPVIQALAADST
jgi:hypothetical protein